MNRDPDALEKGIRYGFGALFGLFITLAIGVQWFSLGWLPGVCIGLVLVLLCSFLARHMGDEFWLTIGKALAWLAFWI
jgi:uncharacterized membrane protein YccC